MPRAVPRFTGTVEAYPLKEEIIGGVGDVLIIADGKPKIITKTEYEFFFKAGPPRATPNRKLRTKNGTPRNLKFEIVRTLIKSGESTTRRLAEIIETSHGNVSSMVTRLRREMIITECRKEKTEKGNIAAVYCIAEAGREYYKKCVVVE